MSKWKFNRVHHIGIIVKDWEKSIKNYERLFGLKPVIRSDEDDHEWGNPRDKWGVNLAAFKIGETHIVLANFDRERVRELWEELPPEQVAKQKRILTKFLDPEYEGFFHLALEVDGIDALHDHLDAQGVETVDEGFEGFRGALARFIDEAETNNVLMHTYDLAYDQAPKTE